MRTGSRRVPQTANGNCPGDWRAAVPWCPVGTGSGLRGGIRGLSPPVGVHFHTNRAESAPFGHRFGVFFTLFGLCHRAPPRTAPAKSSCPDQDGWMGVLWSDAAHLRGPSPTLRRPPASAT